MPSYLKERPLNSILGDRKKRMSVSLRLDSEVFDRIDMISIMENRAANYVINCLLEDTFLEIEEEEGEIIVDQSDLAQFRSKKGRSTRRQRSQ